MFKGPFGGDIPHGVHDQVVELRDVMPTLLDAAGLAIPDSVEGRSLMPIIRGKAGRSWREYIHGEHTSFDQSVQFITNGREKYVWYSGTGHEQLFNLDDDPQELNDVAAFHQDRTTHWRQALIKELTGREEGFTDGRTLIPGRPVGPVLSHILKD